MRFVVTILIMIIFAAIAEWFMPWWSACLVIGILSFLARLNPGQAFLAGMISLGLLWLGFALLQDLPNQHILSTRLAQLFKLPGYIWYLGLTTVLGALLGGLSSWCTSYLNLIRSPKAKS